jgi:hexosaminidase
VLRGSITKIFVFFLLFPWWADADVADNGCSLPLMPCPEKVSLVNGYFSFKQEVNIYIEGMSAQRQKVALSRSALQLTRMENLGFKHFNLVQNKNNADLVIIVSHKKERLKKSAEPSRFPRLGDDESYQLSINQVAISIQAHSDFGVLHGLTTLVQLIYDADRNSDTADTYVKTGEHALDLPQLHIEDKPKFKWRGLLIDSVRHFIPLSDIKRQLDGMAAAKLNVFHWHLNDDQGWRFESKRYPKLHQMASDNLYYTQDEIKDVVAYASLLGIRVVPELDVPGHASAIAVAYPELIADKKHYAMQRHWGVFEPVLDVSDAKVYQFIDDLVAEFSLLFPDSFIHIGGDEVNPTQWLNNNNIKRLMMNENLANVEALHHYFNLKVQAILAKYQRKMMGWDEIYHPDLPKDIVIQSWRGLESMNEFTNHGYQGVLSTGFYIDQPQSSAYHYRNHPIANSDVESKESINNYRTWQLTIPRLKGSSVTGLFVLDSKVNGDKTPVYSGYLKLNNNAYQKVSILTPLHNSTLSFLIDSWMGPLRFDLDLTAQATNRVFIGNAFYPLVAEELSAAIEPNIPLAQHLKPKNTHNVLGGEATLWSELVTQENIDLRTWPRLFVIAERLWSQPQINNIDNMYQRLISMDKYAEKILGLQHKLQQRNGFSRLINVRYPEAKVNSLVRLAQLVEPAHYYTRHHIKYLQGKYHQLAALDSFVDFLAVESVELIELYKVIEAYQQGNKSALSTIKLKVKAWQDNQIVLNSFTTQDANLNALIKDIGAFNQTAEHIVELCGDKPVALDNSFSQLSQHLKQLQEQQNETVIAAIPLFQKLLASCQESIK